MTTDHWPSVDDELDGAGGNAGAPAAVELEFGRSVAPLSGRWSVLAAEVLAEAGAERELSEHDVHLYYRRALPGLPR